MNNFVTCLLCPAGETPLLHAARQGHAATAEYLTECGADPSIPSQLGATALHHSAGIGVWIICLNSQKQQYISLVQVL